MVDVASFHQRIPRAAGLARQRQRQPGLFSGRADPQRFRQGGGQLLAQPRLPAGSRQAHRDGDIHVHDLDMLAGYCAGWSLRTLLNEGLNGVPGKVEAGPPKHMSSAVGQIVNFLGTLQNEWAGAQAFSSFDTYMAPFIRNDNLPYDAGQAVHPGTDLQPQRAVALGHADAVHQPDLRLDLPGRPARSRCRSSAARKCRSPTATCRPRWT